MKLSDIKGDRTIDVIAELIDPIANIAEDEKAMPFLKKEPLPEGMDVRKFVINRIRKFVPYILKEHKDDIISILSIVEGKTEQEYVASMTIPKLMNDCVELFTDDIAKVLFISAQSVDSSGSAQENTEASGH